MKSKAHSPDKRAISSPLSPPPLSLSIALSLLLNGPFLYPEETLLMRGEALDFLPSILIESSLRVASHLRRDGKSWWRIVDSHTFSSESSQNEERMRDTWASLSRLKEEKRLKCRRLWVACFSSANQFNPSVGCQYSATHVLSTGTLSSLWKLHKSSFLSLAGRSEDGEKVEVEELRDLPGLSFRSFQSLRDT